MNFKLLKTAALTLTSVISFAASAESLNCQEMQSFRQASMFINRDGAIGFNGTYITIDASWFIQAGFNSLDQLTSRKSDKNLQPTAIVLHLSPKGACTNNGDSLSEDFSCSVKNGEIDVTGKEFKEISDGSAVSFEDISKRIRVNTNVNIDAKIKENDDKTRSVQLTGVITNAKTGASVKLNESMKCTVDK